MIFADPGCAALFEEYSRECANPLLGPIRPQQHLYAPLEEMGIAQCFAAYRNGNLCGVAVVLVSVLPHFGGDRKFATLESLFVASDVRRTGLGEMLMQAVEEHATDVGCEAIFYSAPVGSRFAQMLFLYEDRYTHTNFTFCRRLA